MLSTRCWFKEVNSHLCMLQVTMQVGRDVRTRCCELWVTSWVWTYESGHVARITSFTKILFVLSCLLSFAICLLPPVFSILCFLIPICLHCLFIFPMLHLSIFLVFLLFFSSFVPLFLYSFFGTNLTSQNSIYEEIKSRLKSGNVLLLFVAEYFVFQFAIQKYKH